MSSARAPFAVYNSPLSEVGALGFEYGYSVRASGSLVLWEAQFGDFVNNAQAIVDEFIVSARAKWGQRSGLVLLLPHGYEGQGPNHSSAHLERFLQLAAEDNIRVAYCTTAAQYFHLLRRQASLLQTDPRPLIVITAKSLLRHPAAGSTLKDLSESSFKSVIDDQRAHSGPGVVERLILCSGKVFVDLVTSEAYREAQRVAVLRVEELYPFPVNELSGLLRQYRWATEVVWLQEEPQNRGAWTFIAPLLQELLDSRVQLRYIGRPARSSPAEGSMTLHRVEQERIIREAFFNVGRGSDMEKKEVVHGC
jgi:2-oxoglutarate dehydrogenase E1 component